MIQRVDYGFLEPHCRHHRRRLRLPLDVRDFNFVRLGVLVPGNDYATVIIVEGQDSTVDDGISTAVLSKSLISPRTGIYSKNG